MELAGLGHVLLMANVSDGPVHECRGSWIARASR